VDEPTLADDLAHAVPRPRAVASRVSLAIRGRSRAPFDVVTYGGAVASMSLGHPFDVGAMVFLLGLTSVRIFGARRWAKRLARDGVLVDATIETHPEPDARTIASFELDGERRAATIARGRDARSMPAGAKGHALVAPGVRYAWILAPDGAVLVALDRIAIPRAELRRA
jgi:hypothetical protein